MSSAQRYDCESSGQGCMRRVAPDGRGSPGSVAWPVRAKQRGPTSQQLAGWAQQLRTPQTASNVQHSYLERGMASHDPRPMRPCEKLPLNLARVLHETSTTGEVHQHASETRIRDCFVTPLAHHRRDYHPGPPDSHRPATTSYPVTESAAWTMQSALTAGRRDRHDCSYLSTALPPALAVCKPRAW